MPEEGKGNQVKHQRGTRTEIQRLQLAGTSSTVFAVNLILHSWLFLSISQFKRCMGRGESKKRTERGLEWGSEKTVSHLLDLQNVKELRLTRKTL